MSSKIAVYNTTAAAVCTIIYSDQHTPSRKMDVSVNLAGGRGYTHIRKGVGLAETAYADGQICSKRFAEECEEFVGENV